MSTQNKDREFLLSVVREMTKSMTGKQSTKHWSSDVLWYDIPPFASRGIEPAIKMFDTVFGSFKSYEVFILETDVMMSELMGVVCTIQKIDILFKDGTRRTVMVRETDVFKKDEDNQWFLVHQHASVPSGGDWDGRIIIA
ncbi:MAG TPA: nuclear transport factor 2 family protein [Puia sp.]|nr:nuclear transport factor 2 family protein [Puia sp.]